MARETSGVGTERPKPRPFLRVAAIWIPLAGLYLLFAGSVGKAEGLTALVCASLGTLWARRAGRIGEAAFRLRADMLRPLAGAGASLPGQTLQVGFDLMRTIVDGSAAGSIQSRPMSSMFRHAPSDDGAESQAERALGVLAASLAPRRYVLRLDPARSEVLLHAFESQPARRGVE